MANFAVTIEHLHAYTTKSVTLSGTVKLSGVGVKRVIYLFRNSDYSASIAQTMSAADGSFSATVIGSKGDRFTAICIGASGENDLIFSKIAGV